MKRTTSISRTGLLCTTGATALCLALQPSMASAQDTPAPGATQANAEILVTGSRIKRDGFDASTPVAVVNEEDIKLSGTVNVERMLSEQPQFVASTNGGATSNTVPGGTADVNLRGFGATRNLVLVNGRRFAIAGPEQTTDLNTIPTALIARTEIVTGGSSAVYGSDAITGVVNFIMRDDFEGVEGRAQIGADSSTKSFNKSFTVTAGGNFAEDRGNVVVSFDYATRDGITRGERGGFTGQSLNDGCVTSDSATPFGGGTRLTVPAGQTCRGAGGIPGFFFAPGSGDIPNSRLSGIPLPGSAQSNPALNAAYAAAGLSAMSSFGVTFDPGGTTQRPALDPADRYDLAPDNYLVIPQERWMINTFAHYDFTPGVTGYLEGHYSSNEVKMQLAPSNVGVPTLLNVNNPYLSPAMREVLNQLDLRETGTTTVVSGPATRTTTPGDGLAALTIGKRYVEAGPRQADEKRNVFRVTGGLRGDIGSKDEGFLSDLSYDAYYTYARTETTELLFNALSRSRLQASQLSAGGGAAPVCNVFGANVSEACANAIRISATNTTEATLQVASASLTGNLFELPGGPAGFSVGGEWRKTEAQYRPDSFLSSGDVVGFNAGLPTGGSISAKEVFGEVRLPILADTPFFEELTLNGAFRYSDYSLDGVGGVWTYLGGGEWQPVEDIRFRAQFQHAIRAPNVADLYAGSTRSVPVATDPCSSRQPAAQQTSAVRAVCVATGVPAAAVFTAGVQPNNFFPVDAGGNPNLGPEESDTFTAGIVLTPRFVPNLRISADYFDIELDGAIAPLGGGLNNTLNLCYNVLQDASSEFCQAVNRNPVTGEINDPYTVKILQANTGALETSGIDFALNYDFEIGWLGRISIGSDWTWTDEFTATPVQAMPQIQNECVGSWGLTCGEPIPEWRGITRINLQGDYWSVGIRHRYIGSVTNDRYILPLRSGGTPPALDTLSYPVLPSRNYFDLNFTIDAVENFQIFGGARNVFNQKPPAVGSQSVRSNTWPATYDVLGTEFFLGLIAKL
jgi:outer membrane receptor protein involved in Fe transport